jgi:Flp pilus assembly protein TadG
MSSTQVAQMTANSRRSANGQILRSLCSQVGQSAVEFGLIAPVIILLLVIGSDVARVFTTSLTLGSAAQAGVQYGAQNRSSASDFSGMRTAASNDANGLPGFSANASNFCLCDGASTSCTSAAGCASNFQLYVKVTTTASFSTLLPYPGITRTLSLQGNATMLVP